MLTYTQHGGSGHHLSLADLHNIEISRLVWMAEQLEETRRAEAKALREASGK